MKPTADGWPSWSQYLTADQSHGVVEMRMQRKCLCCMRNTWTAEAVGVWFWGRWDVGGLKVSANQLGRLQLVDKIQDMQTAYVRCLLMELFLLLSFLPVAVLLLIPHGGKWSKQVRWDIRNEIISIWIRGVVSTAFARLYNNGKMSMWNYLCLCLCVRVCVNTWLHHFFGFISKDQMRKHISCSSFSGCAAGEHVACGWMLSTLH